MPKRAPVISEEVLAIREKLDTDPSGKTLTRGEKKREVNREEAAYLLSAIAGRAISAEYIRQLIRTDRGAKPRLSPARSVGNTYLFTVDSLLRVRFTRAHKEEEAIEDAA